MLKVKLSCFYCIQDKNRAAHVPYVQTDLWRSLLSLGPVTYTITANTNHVNPAQYLGQTIRLWRICFMFLQMEHSSPLDWFRALVKQNGFMKVLRRKSTSDRVTVRIGDRKSWTFFDKSLSLINHKCSACCVGSWHWGSMLHFKV